MCVHMCDGNLSHTAKSLEHGNPNYRALKESHVNRNYKFIWNVESSRHLCHGSPWPMSPAHSDSMSLHVFSLHQSMLFSL